MQDVRPLVRPPEAPATRTGCAAMTPLEEAQSVMHQLLAEHGAWSPLELLLAANQLQYDDYRAWLRGEHDTLDGDLAGGPEEAFRLLREVRKKALSLNLEPQSIPVYGIEDNAGAELRASAHGDLDELLRTKFQAPTGQPQLDLFIDTKESAAASDVATALLARDAKAAEQRLRELEAINPQHWALPDATTLLDAVKAAPPQPADAVERLALLEQRWLRAASAILQAQAREFMVPLWRELGRALEGVPFDASNPHRHAAWAYRNGLDWANVRRVVRDAGSHPNEPQLVGWLAEAERRLGHAQTARRHWFAICWREPAYFERLVEAPSFPDPALRHAWEDMLDANVEPPLSTPWLPAWTALPAPALALGMPRCKGESPPERAFDTLLALLAGGSDRDEMANRKALQALHPGLLMRYLETRET